MTLEQVIALLQEHANPQAVQGMARFGISSTQTLQRCQERMSHVIH